MKQMKFPIQDVGQPLTEDNMAIAVVNGNDQLRKRLNQALKNIIADGTYERISHKYFSRNISTSIRKEATPKP
jgi:polar amino acid transport system substrate-binding protein